MPEKILVTGGAGFIGSFLVDALVERGHTVRVYDSLVPQVHGEQRRVPDYLNPGAEFVRGDVRDRDHLASALDGMDVVFHLAAAVGIGQSMYQIQYYTDVNAVGGATLLDIVANTRHKVRKMVVASSMSLYGEGKYECADHGVVYPRLRTEAQLQRHDWEVKCPHCGRAVSSLPTDEEKTLSPTSIYSITKRDQEEMFLATGHVYGIPTVALRFFNTYGPRQALSNPYNGVMAIFSARLLNGQPPVIYEDGEQSRDLIHVSDIVRGLLLAMERSEADNQVVNLGTGVRTSVHRVGELLAQHIGGPEPVVVEKFRAGDIRHCYADITRARALLGFAPRISLEDGLADLVAWVRQQTAEDRFDQVEKELASRSLVK